MASCLGANVTAYAEDAANASATNPNETIAHIEKALIEINKSDFFAANLHLKAARLSSEHIAGDAVIIKQANADVVQGQIESRSGDVKKSSALLSKALELYKSL